MQSLKAGTPRVHGRDSNPRKRSGILSRLEFALHPGNVGAIPGVYPDRITFGNEIRDLDFQAGFSFHFFRDTRGRVTSNGGLGMDYLQINRGGQLNIERPVLVKCQFGFQPFLEEFSGLAQDIQADSRLFEGVHIHEVIELPIRIQVLNIMEIQADILDAVTGLESLFQTRTGAQVERFDADRCVAPAWLVVMVIEHFVQAAIQLKGYAFAKIININHKMPRFKS